MLNTEQRDIASQVVVTVFQGVAADLLGESVQVELVGGDHAAGTLRGRVGWNGDGWHILVSGHLQGRGLLRCLFHELAHILFKGRVRGSGRDWIPGTRDLLTGTDTGAARVERERINAHARKAATDYFEEAADCWADGMTVLLWGSVADGIASALKACEQALEETGG